MTLSANEYKALTKIARQTKMDCWFSIEQKENGEDFVRDIETGKAYDLKEGVLDLVSGFVGSCEIRLLPEEQQAFLTLLDKLGITGGAEQ